MTMTSWHVGVFDTVRVGLVLVGHDGRVIDANRASLEMLDLRREDVVGHVCSAVRVAGGMALLDGPLLEGEPPQLIHVQPGDGRERWLERTARPLSCDDAAWVCELVDVTEARAATIAQRLAERRLQTLVANLPGVVYRCRNDRDWTVEMISESVLALTGHTSRELVSGTVTYASLIFEEDRERVWNEVQVALSAKRPFQLLYRLKHKDGRKRWVWEQGSGVVDDDGNLLALEGFLSDVTELRTSEERYRCMFERNQAIKWILDPRDGRIIDVNEAAARFYGYSKEQLLRMKVTDINVNPPEKVHADMSFAAKEQRVYFEFKHRKASGEIVDVEVHSGPIELDGETFLFSIVHDISEKRRLEEALRHAQRMEALGRLAGGVAHDFNNLMTVIVGASSLVLRDLPDASAHKERITEIAEAGKRAARLTRQLLAVGRRQLLAPQIIDVHEQVRGMRSMLRGALPAHVDLEIVSSVTHAWVEADPDQLEQVVLNLALNAGDAMRDVAPGAATLTLRISRLDVARRDPASLDVPPGTYVLLEAVDTGVGIDPVRVRHIFEPFYTTKPGHAGSGLGLATVYGIVKQSGGNVSVESTPGQGSTFKVALPSAQRSPIGAAAGHGEPNAAPQAPQARGRALRGSETVLVVDDDELVRRLTALMLEVQGYRVLVARDPEDALRIAVEHEGPIHLVLTDVMMPTLAGGALVERLLPIRPDLRVLFVSGYVDEVAAPMPPIPLQQGARVAFMQKPVTAEALAAKVRTLLDA